MLPGTAGENNSKHIPPWSVGVGLVSKVLDYIWETVGFGFLEVGPQGKSLKFELSRKMMLFFRFLGGLHCFVIECPAVKNHVF